MRLAFCLIEGNRRLTCFWFFLIWATPDSSIVFESHLTEIILWRSSAKFWRVNPCSFSSLVSTRRLTSAYSADTRPCANIKHLKSSAVSSASLKSLQSLFTGSANVRKFCWLSLTVFRHFQRLWNKVVLGPDNLESSLIVSEKSKSVVFLSNMKSTNLLCSVVPSFLNSRRTFFY